MTKIEQFTRKYKYLLLLVIIILSGVLRVYYIYEKEAFHLDEILSFQIVSGDFYSTYEKFDAHYKDKWTTGKVFTDLFFTINAQNYKQDLKRLFKDTKDHSHPNLYYIALRLVLLKGIRGIDGLFKFFGIGLNIFFYSIGAFILYQLFSNIYNKKTYAVLGVFLYSICVGSISTSIYIRMYELLALSIIITIFTVFKILDKENASILHFSILCVVSTLGYLSHYYYNIFVLILLSVISYHYLTHKKTKVVVYYIFAFIQGAINAQILYPQFIQGFVTSGRAKEAYSKIDLYFLMSQFITKVKITLHLINENVIYFLPFMVVFILISVCYSYFKKKQIRIKRKEVYLIFISFSLSFVVIYISPYNIMRYLSCAIPILIVLPLMFIRVIPLKHLRYLAVVSLCFFYIFQCANMSNINYLYKGDRKKLIFQESPSAPVYFLYSSHWAHRIVSGYFVGSQRYKVIHDEQPALDFNETESKSAFLIIEGYPRLSMIKNEMEIQKWVIRKEVNYRSLIIIKIEKVKADPCWKVSEDVSQV
jgi:hypothetical protein